ncbi:MAG: hypothetical protein CMB12_00120 [Euryarchaeota archaeon]|nr:hypothetical protein [Euryarchaeota archaeon]
MNRIGMAIVVVMQWTPSSRSSNSRLKFSSGDVAIHSDSPLLVELMTLFCRVSQDIEYVSPICSPVALTLRFIQSLLEVNSVLM